jgi:hypothetical protein
MQEDLGIIESKLESQERFWRSKLRTVEEEYHQQITKLREEIKIVSIAQAQRRESASKSEPTTPIKSAPISQMDKLEAELPPKVVAAVSTPQTFKKAPANNLEAPRRASLPVSTVVEVKVMPVAKPRKSVSKFEPVKELVPPPAPIHHEYEEPDDFHNSDHVSDYSYSEPSPNDTELSELKKKEKQEKVQREKMSQMEVVRSRVIEQMNNELSVLGIQPDGTQLPGNEMTKILGRMKHQRKNTEEVT